MRFALVLPFILFAPLALADTSDCKEVAKLIETSSGNGYDIFWVMPEALELFRRSNIPFDYKGGRPSGEAFIRKIGRNSYEMLSRGFATDPKQVRRQFQLKNKGRDCYVTNIRLPDFQENEEEYPISLFDDGLLLNADSAHAPLLVPRN